MDFGQPNVEIGWKMANGQLLFLVLINHIAQNFGREKLWQIRDFKVLARKTLANAQHLYHWQEKNFGKSEGLSFINSLKWFVFDDALSHDQ